MTWAKISLIAFFLVIIFCLNFFSIRNKTLTIDANAYYRYGESVLNLKFKRSGYTNTMMPFSAFNVLPKYIAKYFNSEKIKKFLSKKENGRIVTMLFSLLLAIFVFRWSSALYGNLAGFFSLALFTFSPNIIAHSKLITSDLYAACFITIALYYYWKFLNEPSIRTLTISSITFGFAQLAKYSAIFLYPIFLIILLFKYWSPVNNYIKNLKFQIPVRRLLKYTGAVLLFLAVSTAVINIGFLFDKFGTPFGEYKFSSSTFKNVQKMQWLNQIPIPLPYPYLQGIDMLTRASSNHRSRSYLLGQLAEPNEGFKGYYLIAYLLKVPISIQIFVIISLIIIFTKRKSFSFRDNESFLLIPVIIFFTYMNLFHTRNIGFRYVLWIMPLLFIFCGILFKEKKWTDISLLQKIGTAFLICYLIISNLSYFPHYISYFNEIVWNRKMSYKYLVDSNLDWWQNDKYLQSYKKKHPEAIYGAKKPTAGTIIISANRLVGIFNPDRYKWLRENFNPVDHIAYSYLVFKITEEDLKKLK